MRLYRKSKFLTTPNILQILQCKNALTSHQGNDFQIDDAFWGELNNITAEFDAPGAFVALPGGLGTLEAFTELLTWAQLGQHAKPVVVANIGGFWSPFLSLLSHMRAETFIRDGLDVRFAVVDEASDILPTIQKLWDGSSDAGEADVLAKF